MDNIVVGVVVTVALLVLSCSGYLWYLTSGAEESKPISIHSRR